MALDEALMDSVRDGAEPVLRFYRWVPHCLSFGRNQPATGRYDRERIARRGLDVVRRPTGGRAVIHGRELTYSVVVAEGVLGSPRGTYHAINRALLAGIRALGVPARLQARTGASAPIPSTSPCFRDPTEGEVVVEDRKLVGSAQYRCGGVILQHGSLLLADDQSGLRTLEFDPAPASELRPAVLSEYLDAMPPWEALTGAIAEGWRREVGGTIVPAEVSAREMEGARVLQGKHRDLEWIWRR